MRKHLFMVLLVFFLPQCTPKPTAISVDQPVAVAEDKFAQGETPPSLPAMLARVSPAVVNISVRGTRRAAQNPLFEDPLFRRFFGLPEDSNPRTTPVERFQAAGSGVITDANRGYIITNSHVVENADKIQVTLTDRRQLDAALIASDKETDVAVLKITADRLTSLQLGISRELRVGEYVVAIGNPFGVGQAATFGIVSAVGRTGLGIEGYEDFIQTDASINPGNSGGALVDMAGRLVGINAAIISRSGGNVGVGFAIPVDMVKSVADQLIAQGKVSRGALGVTVQDFTPSLAQAMGLAANPRALISQVLPRSAAVRAGLLEGDVITKLNGAPVSGSSQLRNAVAHTKPGTTVVLTLFREGKERSLTAVLDEQAITTAETSAKETPEKTPLSGMTLSAIPRDDPQYGKVEGAYVADVDGESPAAEAGIRQGDVITSVNRTPVKTPADLARNLRIGTNGPVLLQIRRGDASLFLALG